MSQKRAHASPHAGRITSKVGGDCGIAADGTRAGNPGEENLVSMIWWCTANAAAVLPIKVGS